MTAGLRMLPSAATQRPFTRLALASLATAQAGARRPGFDPSALQPGILHLGCGAFHRAHQAFLTQKAIEAELGGGPVPPWGIVSTSLRTPQITCALAAQDGLFTVLERGAEETTATIVGTLREWIFAPTQEAALRSAFLNPEIKILTLTVTVSGYCTDARTGRLDFAHPSIREDLRQGKPATAIGVLVNGLRLRRDSALAPPVVLSCDNLPANGRVLRQMCIDYAALHDDGLSNWIAQAVSFPTTMVDRIVPVCTPRDREDARTALSLIDDVPVSSEPYAQWVIEHFDGPRPRWDAAGAEYVHDASPWEASKLRLHNGGHLAIACLGRLAGCTTVAEVVSLPGFCAFALRFMLDEQKPTLPPSDHDIRAYATQLLARWRIRGVVHQLDRIMVNGSAKLPARLLAPLCENRRANRPAPCTLLAVAAWMLCTLRRDGNGMRFQLEDAMEAQLARCAAASGGNPERLVDLLLALPEIFGSLQGDAEIRCDLKRAALLVAERGAKGAVAACMSGALDPLEAG
ncbi:MAG: mannitol dehydrogenase family protein [Variovorax sp.]|nr:MAG: mannitol dehydrogenase family protein [Variovorax sp.]